MYQIFLIDKIANSNDKTFQLNVVKQSTENFPTENFKTKRYKYSKQ